MCVCVCVLFSVDQLFWVVNVWYASFCLIGFFFINIQNEIYCVMYNGMYGLWCTFTFYTLYIKDLKV